MAGAQAAKESTQQGKIVEHWDAVQDIPGNSPNPHAFF
jgi:predicted SnoaL-like aldol condensation-catalyzing enzyme